jgi:hypothetical protein
MVGNQCGVWGPAGGRKGRPRRRAGPPGPGRAAGACRAQQPAATTPVVSLLLLHLVDQRAQRVRLLHGLDHDARDAEAAAKVAEAFCRALVDDDPPPPGDEGIWGLGGGAAAPEEEDKDEALFRRAAPGRLRWPGRGGEGRSGRGCVGASPRGERSQGAPRRALCSGQFPRRLCLVSLCSEHHRRLPARPCLARAGPRTAPSHRPCPPRRAYQMAAVHGDLTASRLFEALLERPAAGAALARLLATGSKILCTESDAPEIIATVVARYRAAVAAVGAELDSEWDDR